MFLLFMFINKKNSTTFWTIPYLNYHCVGDIKGFQTKVRVHPLNIHYNYIIFLRFFILGSRLFNFHIKEKKKRTFVFLRILDKFKNTWGLMDGEWSGTPKQC